ncbi:hypothetical protein UCD39_19750 [Nitrospirillum sp. BR 11752]|uniref:hypothetical protein n=1 Tax=Nitrospirillum sp. BR 11752 TaxID=3104293 RepID=UPI002EBAF8C5|nr:hypothetical protein [Nitrospirillum sp. BR 11752]
MDLPVLRKFTLAGPRGDGRHPYVNDHGAFIGAAVPLLERDGRGRWQARDRRALVQLFTKGYGYASDMDRRMRQLDRVAHALNKGEPALAHISLVHAALPPLANDDAALAMAEMSDLLLKGGWGDEPRVPGGTPEGGEWTTGGDDSGSGNAALKDPPSALKARKQGHKLVVIENSDGSTETRSGGSRAWRNNNPGNLGYKPGGGDEYLAHRYGAIGSDGERAIFPDEASGIAAQKALLLGKYGDNTVDEMIGNWADKKIDDVPAYRARIHLWTGLTGNEKVKGLTAEELSAVMAAQRRQEGWKVGTVSRKGA